MKPAPDRRLSSLKLKHGLWVSFLSADQRLLSPPGFFSSSPPRGQTFCRGCANSAAPGAAQHLERARRRACVRVLCIKTRCRAKLCCCCTKCPAARCAVTVGTLGDQGLHTQLTTEIIVLRVAQARRCAYCRTVLHGAQGNL